ncbi:DUF551 domain-containing protein [Escherichia coli]|uniref:DUF551 domain-containing protein n=1 Tax=Escherichia coli TaxID=562 RepID=UPI0006A0CB9C|nr:DUF551 domain-containing protein [Escherichia coli]KNA40550.1 hypothetical protein ERYG_05140 [Escherichia coli M114]
MTTITRENAEIKSFITGFLSDPAHDNQSSDSLLANVFRIALASLEAEAPSLPGGFTIKETQELYEDLVRSHISQALSGEKMKKKDREADLRWIHDVIVQAAWFVKASLEKNALSGTPPVTPDGWISCSERMPEKGQNVLISMNIDSEAGPLIYSARYLGGTFRRGGIAVSPGNDLGQATHWMPLPEPPQEANQ